MFSLCLKNEINERTIGKFLHPDEVISNVFLFMIAGYETTSTALAYGTYVLATQVDIQDKLFKEIDQFKWSSMNVDEIYDAAMNLSYLDLFIREVLRMYPITSKAMTRECNTTTLIKGHTIEKGLFCFILRTEQNISIDLVHLKQEVSFNQMYSLFTITPNSGDLSIQTSSHPNDMLLNDIQ